MDIIVKAKNCDVPERVRDEAREKVEHATRFFDRLSGVELVFAEESNPRIAEPALVELTGRTKGHYIRAEGVGEDHRAAVDTAVARFERQLSRYKARLVDRRRRTGQRPEPTTAELVDDVVGGDGRAPAPEADDAPRIVRRKTFELSEMVPEDAALALELLGHDFYLFTNAANGRCSVVYRRRDGDLGLIEAAD